MKLFLYKSRLLSYAICYNLTWFLFSYPPKNRNQYLRGLLVSLVRSIMFLLNSDIDEHEIDARNTNHEMQRFHTTPSVTYITIRASNHYNLHRLLLCPFLDALWRSVVFWYPPTTSFTLTLFRVPYPLSTETLPLNLLSYLTSPTRSLVYLPSSNSWRYSRVFTPHYISRELLCMNGCLHCNK